MRVHFSNRRWGWSLLCLLVGHDATSPDSDGRGVCQICGAALPPRHYRKYGFR